MKIFKNWKVVLAIVLVFVAGTVTGSVLTVVHFKHAFERGFKIEHWNSETMKVLDKDLKLTPEQKPRVRAIVEETGQQFVQAFGEAIRVSGTNLVVSWQRIDQELRPEQRIIHEQKCEEFRQKVKKALKIELPPDSGQKAQR